MNELVSLYKDILHSVDCIIDPAPDFTVRYNLNDEKNGHINEIITLKNGKHLVLPTKELLDGHTDWTKVTAFHPACEGLLGGQSIVLNGLLILINFKLTRTAMLLAASIAELAQNKELQNSLSIRQSDLLAPFTFDKSSYKLLAAVNTKNTGFNGEFPLLTLRLHRGGEIAGVKYARVCTIVPHFMMNEKTICGCTPSSKNANETIRNLFRVLLPDELEYGNNKSTFPYLGALLEGYFRTATRMNTINSILGKYSHAELIDLAWYKDIGNLHKWYKQYLPRSLEGNLGKPIVSKSDGKVEEPVQNTTSQGLTKLIIPSDESPAQPEENIDLTKTKPNTNPLGINLHGSTRSFGGESLQSLSQPQNSYRPEPDRRSSLQQPLERSSLQQRPNGPRSVTEVALSYSGYDETNNFRQTSALNRGNNSSLSNTTFGGRRNRLR